MSPSLMSEKNQFQVSKLHTSHISQSMSLFLVIVSQELLQVQISTSHGLKLEVLGLEGGFKPLVAQLLYMLYQYKLLLISRNHVSGASEYMLLNQLQTMKAK